MAIVIGRGTDDSQPMISGYAIQRYAKRRTRLASELRWLPVVLNLRLADGQFRPKLNLVVLVLDFAMVNTTSHPLVRFRWRVGKPDSDEITRIEAPLHGVSPDGAALKTREQPFSSSYGSRD